MSSRTVPCIHSSQSRKHPSFFLACLAHPPIKTCRPSPFLTPLHYTLVCAVRFPSFLHLWDRQKRSTATSLNPASLVMGFPSNAAAAVRVMLVSSLLAISLFSVATAGNFYRDVDVTWGDGRGQVLNNGQLLTLSLDRASGSGFQSKNEYLFGKIDMQIKLVPGNSAGTVTAYYLSSQGPTHDEIDFEFLGNLSGNPYTLHTNVFSQGKGNREQQFKLWFDPTKDFHTYSILWNPQHIMLEGAVVVGGDVSVAGAWGEEEVVTEGEEADGSIMLAARKEPESQSCTGYAQLHVTEFCLLWDFAESLSKHAESFAEESCCTRTPSLIVLTGSFSGSSFSVDGIPIRDFRNNEARGVPFPKNQPMRIYSSLWNADDWATRGGLVKTDWSKAPFVASYRNFIADACVASRGTSICSSKGASASGSQSSAWWNQELDAASRKWLRWVEKNYMIYNYCTDVGRFPPGLPTECRVA
ncbi:hypothetical protein Taro_034401 [Colocasia esculenta]|uniref:xyloglucan:xyloglucosyl transferase n=1 Tax=Colocasia esculenta TaxID=4460 RepID=A0A843WFE6_COLES|nr:hypothetical protein [Colocasia esculenta]